MVKFQAMLVACGNPLWQKLSVRWNSILLQDIQFFSETKHMTPSLCFSMMASLVVDASCPWISRIQVEPYTTKRNLVVH